MRSDPARRILREVQLFIHSFVREYCDRSDENTDQLADHENDQKDHAKFPDFITQTETKMIPHITFGLQMDGQCDAEQDE